jgi:hypothetical protein
MEVDVEDVKTEALMEWGLLWFDDNSKVSVATKVKRAARQYREKFGRRPDTCFVHPTTFSGEATMPKGIDVRESKHIQPNHFWIGRTSRSH